MQSVLTYILEFGLAAVLIVLLVGVAVFVRGGEFNRRWSVKLMSLRVITQAVVVVALGALLLMKSLN